MNHHQQGFVQPCLFGMEYEYSIQPLQEASDDPEPTHCPVSPTIVSL